MLTGCLKLFFRELKEPLVPFPFFEKALQITAAAASSPEKNRRFKGARCLPLNQHYTYIHHQLIYVLHVNLKGRLYESILLQAHL